MNDARRKEIANVMAQIACEIQIVGRLASEEQKAVEAMPGETWLGEQGRKMAGNVIALDSAVDLMRLAIIRLERAIR